MINPISLLTKKERNSGDNEEPSDNELDSLWNLWEKTK